MSQPPMPPGPPRQPYPQPQPEPLPHEPWPQYGMLPGGPQPSYGPVPVQQPPRKPKRFGWPTVIITAVVALGVGAVVALGVGGLMGGGGDSGTTAEPIATVTATETAMAESAPTPSKAPEAKKTSKPESTMEEGQYEIGVDAEPGRYKTTVPESSPGCYWERMKDDTGDFDSLIVNGEVNPGRRVSITLKRGDFFNSEDCGTWTRV